MRRFPFLIVIFLVLLAGGGTVISQQQPKGQTGARLHFNGREHLSRKILTPQMLEQLKGGKQPPREMKRRAVSLVKTVQPRFVPEALQAVSAGVQEAWVQSYPSTTIDTTEHVPWAVAIDGSGNVYVTGYSGPEAALFDYATVKYNSSGVQQWVRTFNNEGNDEDGATAIAVDASGNVYVTGYSIRAGPNFGLATVKYSSIGTQLWVARYDPGGTCNKDASIAVDGSGNVYIASARSGTGWDLVVVKYSSSGIEQWARIYNGPANGDDVAQAIALDGSGNIYLAGYSGLYPNYDFITIKYDPSGSQQWLQTYNGPASDLDIATSLALDASSNVYVTGYGGAYPNFDFETVKYNSSGTQQWAATYAGPGSNADFGVAVAAASGGEAYVTGYGWSGIDYDFVTIKYSTSGSQQWLASYDAGSDDKAQGIAIDSDGSVYVVGPSIGSSGTWDFATVKYTSSGTQLWTARYNRVDNTNDEATSITVDGSGNVAVAGPSTGTSLFFGSVYTTVKYTQSIYASVKVFLQGPFNTSTGQMNKSLNTSGILASRFPGVSVPSEAVDSVTIEIRNAQSAASSTIRKLSPAWLMTDGTIRDFNDASKSYMLYEVARGNYYVVVWHRNHLAIMTATVQVLGNAPPASPYNFSASQSQAFGSNPMKQVGSIFAMISGDVDGNGVLNAADRGTAWNQRGQEGYLTSDVDVNGVCNAADRGIIWNNRGSETQIP